MSYAVLTGSHFVAVQTMRRLSHNIGGARRFRYGGCTGCRRFSHRDQNGCGSRTMSRRRGLDGGTRMSGGLCSLSSSVVGSCFGYLSCGERCFHIGLATVLVRRPWLAAQGATPALLQPGIDARDVEHVAALELLYPLPLNEVFEANDAALVPQGHGLLVEGDLAAYVLHLYRLGLFMRVGLGSAREGGDELDPSYNEAQLRF